MDPELAKKFGTALYFMVKQTCKTMDWKEFLAGCDMTESDWHEIKLHLEVNLKIKTYV
jgi:hypothetical protein